MLKITDSTGKVVGVLSDEDSVPKMDEELKVENKDSHEDKDEEKENE